MIHKAKTHKPLLLYFYILNNLTVMFCTSLTSTQPDRFGVFQTLRAEQQLLL